MDAAAAAELQAQLSAAIKEIGALQVRLSALEERKNGSSCSPASTATAMPYLQLHQSMHLATPFRRTSSVPSIRQDGQSQPSAATQLQSGNGSSGHGGEAPLAGPSNGAVFSLSGAAAPTASAVQAQRVGSQQLGELEVPMAATRVVMTQLVSPAESAGMNICSGGTVLSWIDICAGLAAKTLARGPVVTASVDAVHFLRPCHVGSVVIIAAMVNRTFKSSMEVGVRVEEECIRTGARHHCCSAYLTFVALSRKSADGGPPVKKVLPRVYPTTPYYNATHEQAARRREQRLQLRERLKSDPELSAQEAECRLHPITHREVSPTLPPALRVDPSAGGRKRRIKPSLTTAHMTNMILPAHANTIGITFGGNVMRWMEQCAFIAASRVGRSGSLLTAGMDSIAFACPTRVGDTVYIEGQVTAIFRSSVEVMISVWGETPDIGEVFHCGDAYATVVSVTEHGDPVDVPFELVPTTQAEKLRYRGAVERREERLAMREQLRRQMTNRASLDGTIPSCDEEEDDASMEQALQA